MIQTQENCSTPDQLLTFLRGQLSSQEESELQLHLNDCVSCRERLENAAADANAWNEAKQFLGSGALHASSDDSTSSHEEATQGSQRIRQVLDALGPTDDPESLGRIGGYEVTGVVGAGGMGVVLKAHDRSLDRIVAIKVMSPHLASSGSARRRFAREAKAAAAVLHPNVIAIHGVASDDARPYLVMPYVRGSSLQKRIDSQGPLPLKDTLRIGAQIAAGLAAAHEQGLVHRDIKPANILLEDGVERVTITDFGLARAVDDASMTCSGVIAGTPQYMSPEQTRGESIDARSDLFSLGSVLYAMCAGRSPFRAETTYGVLHRIANDNPTPVCEANSDVPVWLGHIVARLMAKRPEDRFESATQVAELLEGCLAHVQQPAAMPLPASVEQMSHLLPVASSATHPAKKQLRQLFHNLPPIGKFIAAAGFSFSLIFAGILIVLELDKGTLTIESELDDVPIRIMQSEKVVQKLTLTKSGASIRVAAGKYVVKLDTQGDDEIEIRNGTITLHRGRTEIVKLSQQRPATRSDSPNEESQVAAKESTQSPITSDDPYLERRFARKTNQLRLITPKDSEDDPSLLVEWAVDEGIAWWFSESPIGHRREKLGSFPYSFTLDQRSESYIPMIDKEDRKIEVFISMKCLDAGDRFWKSIRGKKIELSVIQEDFTFVANGGIMQHVLFLPESQDGFGDAFDLLKYRRADSDVLDLARKHGQPVVLMVMKPFGTTYRKDSDNRDSFPSNREANSAVERAQRYLSAVIEHDTETIKSVAKGINNSDERTRDMAKLLGEKGIPKLFKTWFENHSAVVAFGPVSSSDEKMNGRFLLFTLSLVDERWSIVDIDLKAKDSFPERVKNLSQKGPVPDTTINSLQGVWEFISVESDGVVSEYQTINTQPSKAPMTITLTITGDMWMVKAGHGSKSSDLGSGGHRVRIEDKKLTFFGMTTSMPGMGNSNEVTTVGYGLFALDGDSLVYLMTPAVMIRDLNGQSEQPIRSPETFETKGTQNNVFRLRRVGTGESAARDTNSSNKVPTTKSSPEFPRTKIMVHDEEGKPREGVQVSLFQVATKEGGQILEINETSDASGMAVNRNLPFGHYEISAKTADGWYLPGYGSKINVEFEKGLDIKLVAPTPNRTAKLVIGSDLGSQSATMCELRFGELKVGNGSGYTVYYAPEPEANGTSKEPIPLNAVAPSGSASYESFPTITNGIEHIGAEIRIEIERNIPQPKLLASHINTHWLWNPTDNEKLVRRYVIANGQARSFQNGLAAEDKSFNGPPSEGSEFFKLPGPSYRVGASLLSLREPIALPLEFEIPAGAVKVFIERFLGKPNAAVMAALDWKERKKQPELWLTANIQRNSAWIERLVNTEGWTYSVPGEGVTTFPGAWREQTLQSGETLTISLGTQHVNEKTSKPLEARVLAEVTRVYNEQTRQLRTELFNPPIPDLTTEQMHAAMLDAAEQYRKQGKVEIASALKTSAETNRLADRITFTGMSGTMSQGFRQITPTFHFEHFSIVLPKAELRYSLNGWSSKAWGDIYPPITGKWELVSVEERDETLKSDAFNEWRQTHTSWTALTIRENSLMMAGDNTTKFDFEVDYESGPLAQYTIRQDGDTKYSGVLMGNGYIDDTSIVVAVDIEGSSKPKTFDTNEGKTTNLTYRRAREAAVHSKATLKAESSNIENEPQAVPDGAMQVFFKQPLNARAVLTKGNDRDLVFPRRVNLPFGTTHYFELSDFPDHAGTRLSGSIELKNVNKQAESYLKRNAVPIEITKDDIERCLKGNVVIKVIYVPNPTTQEADFAVPKVLDSPLQTEGELCEEAERLGATMAVLRLY